MRTRDAEPAAAFVAEDPSWKGETPLPCPPNVRFHRVCNWNAGTPPNAQASIPEPATAALLLFGVTLIAKRRPLRN